MKDYSLLYKSNLDLSGNWDINPTWDIFLSAYNFNDRVTSVFDLAPASRKIWIVFPEYDISFDDYPKGEHCCFPLNAKEFSFLQNDESSFILSLFDELNLDIKNLNIAVDITGFILPYMMFLVKYLVLNGAKKINFLYSEPSRYIKKEDTIFSSDHSIKVRQVHGFEGNHINDISNDLLVIALGYEHRLITAVAEDKDFAKKLQIFGFPSLKPDMYRENLLKANKASEALGGNFLDELRTAYSPAYDPFITADICRTLINKNSYSRNYTNLYLSPLSTKPQALGFVIYYISELGDCPASIIFPFYRHYSPKTSSGISRIWLYTFEV